MFNKQFSGHDKMWGEQKNSGGNFPRMPVRDFGSAAICCLTPFIAVAQLLVQQFSRENRSGQFKPVAFRPCFDRYWAV